jgi:hypothetical protein
MLRLFRFAAKVEVREKTDFGKVQFLRHTPDDARGYITELSAFTRFIREQNTEEDPPGVVPRLCDFPVDQDYADVCQLFGNLSGRCADLRLLFDGDWEAQASLFSSIARSAEIARCSVSVPLWRPTDIECPGMRAVV